MAVSFAKDFISLISLDFCLSTFDNDYYFAFWRGLFKMTDQFRECTSYGLFMQFADLPTDGGFAFFATDGSQLLQRLSSPDGRATHRR